MLSVQSIKERKIEKAIFGGYDVRAVDNFLDELSAEVSALQKENVALKQKLKEINDKNEEYRSVENSMRKALISAQTIANDMVEKANEERDRILREASEIAHQQINTYRQQIAEEQKTLVDSQEKTSKFISAITAFYEKQIKEVVEFSREMPAIDTSKKGNIDDFTLELSLENAKEMNSISDEESGYTNDILEKIKREALNPQTIAEMSKTPTFNDIERDINLDDEEHVVDSKKERHSKFKISELEFGANHKDGKKY